LSIFVQLKFSYTSTSPRPYKAFTDFRFRNAQNKIFGGIDTFYAPKFD
jgi:hypothetical protein